jgi:hypothetical protein
VAWLILILAVLAPVAMVLMVRGMRSRFDQMVAPPSDLRRADDGLDHRGGLAERDGTGGFL